MKKTRIVGIDYGKARIGLSLSDETHLIATPLKTLLVKKGISQTLQDFKERLAPYSLQALVIGYPLLKDGRESAFSHEVDIFISHLQEHFSCPIVRWDERFSSAQVERFLKEEAQLNRKKRQQVVDSLSAVVILQSYLDRQKQCF